MTRPSPSPGLVERMTAAIKAVKAQRHAPITGDEELEARAALAASDRDVLVGRIAELEEALDPFARVARLHDAAGFNRPDEQPCREFFPGIWPTLGDCRKAAALIPLAGEL